jgi:hypothetical protein
MKDWPPPCRRFDAVEAQLFQVERINIDIDRANRILLINPVIRALRQQHRLNPVCAFHKPIHDNPRRITNGIINR